MFDVGEAGVVEIASRGLSRLLPASRGLYRSLPFEADFLEKRAAVLRVDVPGDELDEFLLALGLLGRFSGDDAPDRSEIDEQPLGRLMRPHRWSLYRSKSAILAVRWNLLHRRDR